MCAMPTISRRKLIFLTGWMKEAVSAFIQPLIKKWHNLLTIKQVLHVLLNLSKLKTWRSFKGIISRYQTSLSKLKSKFWKATSRTWISSDLDIQEINHCHHKWRQRWERSSRSLYWLSQSYIIMASYNCPHLKHWKSFRILEVNNRLNWMTSNSTI